MESIRHWWRLDEKRHYRGADRLLICADEGGNKGNRQRAWKLHLQALRDETGMAITVCHYPPGTSKWNKIKHRLFSFISPNWRGKPLLNLETVVNLIDGTRTQRLAGISVAHLYNPRKHSRYRERRLKTRGTRANMGEGRNTMKAAPLRVLTAKFEVPSPLSLQSAA